MRTMEAIYADFVDSLEEKKWDKALEFAEHMYDYSDIVSGEMKEQIKKARANQ